jgi:hypothetical protein
MISKLTVFSQTNTDSLHVKCFTKEEVKTIIKDLKAGDLAKEELNLSQKQIFVLEKTINSKDSIITVKNQEKLNLDKLLKVETEKTKFFEDRSKDLENKVHGINQTNKILSVGSIGLIGILVGVLISK